MQAKVFLNANVNAASHYVNMSSFYTVNGKNVNKKIKEKKILDENHRKGIQQSLKLACHLSCYHFFILSFWSPTERRKTEHRMTEHRMTERRKTEHRMTEHRMT